MKKSNGIEINRAESSGIELNLTKLWPSWLRAENFMLCFLFSLFSFFLSLFSLLLFMFPLFLFLTLFSSTMLSAATKLQKLALGLFCGESYTFLIKLFCGEGLTFPTKYLHSPQVLDSHSPQKRTLPTSFSFQTLSRWRHTIVFFLRSVQKLTHSRCVSV